MLHNYKYPLISNYHTLDNFLRSSAINFDDDINLLQFSVDMELKKKDLEIDVKITNWSNDRKTASLNVRTALTRDSVDRVLTFYMSEYYLVLNT